MAEPPARSSHSPLRRYQASIGSSSGRNVTRVVAVVARTVPSCSTSATPLTTSCVRPPRRRSGSRAAPSRRGGWGRLLGGALAPDVEGDGDERVDAEHDLVAAGLARHRLAQRVLARD